MYFKEIIMTKSRLVRFLKPSMVVQRLKKKLKLTLATGEFQDDAPAVETAPAQEAPAPSQLSPVNPRNTSTRGATANFPGAQEAQQQTDFCKCTRSTTAKFCKCSGNPSTTSFVGAQTAPVQEANSSSATWLVCECSS